MASECEASYLTYEFTQSCPLNKTHWEEQSKRKKCSTFKSKCDGKNLEYHCLLNAYGNQSIEVCAPKTRLVQDYCPAYSLQGKRITDQFNCSEVFGQHCPKQQYFSNTIYQYPACLTGKGAFQASDIPENQTMINTTNNPSEESPETLPIVLIPSLFLVLAIVLVPVWIFKCRGKRFFSRKRKHSRSSKGKDEAIQPLKSLKELRIALVGKTGTGKSATGNTILGKKEFEENLSPQSITEFCKASRASRFNREILVIDTPGLFDTRGNNQKDKYEQERKRFNSLISDNEGLHAIILVLRADSRLTEDDELCVKRLSEFFGENFYKFSIILFTTRDVLERENIKFVRFTYELPKYFRTLVASSGNRKIAFDNTLQPKKDKQVKALIKLIEENVKKNNNAVYQLK